MSALAKSGRMAAVVWATRLAGPAGWAQTADEVAVRSDAESHETTYTAASAGCRIRWIVSSLEINRGVVRHRADCSLPLPEQVPLIARVMARVLGDFACADAPRTLFWGRLYPDARQDYLLAMRLALAAKRSELWDAARGRTRAGNVNDLVRKLSNDAPIHPELRGDLSLLLRRASRAQLLPCRFQQHRDMRLAGERMAVRIERFPQPGLRELRLQFLGGVAGDDLETSAEFTEMAALQFVTACGARL